MAFASFLFFACDRVRSDELTGSYLSYEIVQHDGNEDKNTEAQETYIDNACYLGTDILRVQLLPLSKLQPSDWHRSDGAPRQRELPLLTCKLIFGIPFVVHTVHAIR
jgi:hypothetical protein